LQGLEVCIQLASKAELENLRQENPHFTNREYIDDLARTMVSNGAVEPLTDLIIPPDSMQSDSYREGLTFSLINARQRAVLLCLQWASADNRLNNPAIYAAEAVTAFALRLRGLFPRFLGSEFLADAGRREALFPIPHEDVCALSFPDSCFDLVCTNEVLEHVPSIDSALSELCRILKPGGWHVGTVPFLFDQEESITKAVVREGEIVHLTEPEYHGNPIDDDGSLVFELPGWDIIGRARAAGFAEAHFKYIISSRHACVSEDIGGIFVFCCRK
jgi:SAM-dependent methyltransferase